MLCVGGGEGNYDPLQGLDSPIFEPVLNWLCILTMTFTKHWALATHKAVTVSIVTESQPKIRSDTNDTI